MGIPVHGNYTKYVWRGMTRMEMACNLGLLAEFFKFLPYVSDKIFKNSFWLVFSFENSFNIVPLWSKSSSCMGKVLWYKLIKLVTKKIGKSPWDCPFKILTLLRCFCTEFHFFLGSVVVVVVFNLSIKLQRRVRILMVQTWAMEHNKKHTWN